EAVEFGVVAAADVTAVGEVGGKLVAEGALQEIAQGGELGDLRFVVGDLIRTEGVERGVERGNLCKGIADTAEFAWIAEAVLEAAENARDVADVGEGGAEIGEGTGRGEKGANGGAATADLGEVLGWGGEPGFEQTRAGSGA